MHSHLNVSCYFWSSLLNVDVNYSYILSFYCSGYLKCTEEDLVNYTYFDNCWLLNFIFLGDKWVAWVLDLHLRRRCTNSNNDLVIGIVNSHGMAWAKWTSTILVFHTRGQSLTVLPIFCWMCLVLRIPVLVRECNPHKWGLSNSKAHKMFNLY